MAKYRKYSKEFKLQAAKLVTEQGYYSTYNGAVMLTFFKRISVIYFFCKNFGEPSNV